MKTCQEAIDTVDTMSVTKEELTFKLYDKLSDVLEDLRPRLHRADIHTMYMKAYYVDRKLGQVDMSIIAVNEFGDLENSDELDIDDLKFAVSGFLMNTLSDTFQEILIRYESNIGFVVSMAESEIGKNDVPVKFRGVIGYGKELVVLEVELKDNSASILFHEVKGIIKLFTKSSDLANNLVQTFLSAVRNKG